MIILYVGVGLEKYDVNLFEIVRSLCPFCVRFCLIGLWIDILGSSSRGYYHVFFRFSSHWVLHQNISLGQQSPTRSMKQDFTMFCESLESSSHLYHHILCCSSHFTGLLHTKISLGWASILSYQMRSRCSRCPLLRDTLESSSQLHHFIGALDLSQIMW